MYSICQLEDELDKEIDRLWKLMVKHFKGMRSKQKLTVSLLDLLTEKNVVGKEKGKLQY